MDPASFLVGTAIGTVVTLAVVAGLAWWALSLAETPEETSCGLRAGDMAQGNHELSNLTKGR